MPCTILWFILQRGCLDPTCPNSVYAACKVRCQQCFHQQQSILIPEIHHLLSSSFKFLSDLLHTTSTSWSSRMWEVGCTPSSSVIWWCFRRISRREIVSQCQIQMSMSKRLLHRLASIRAIHIRAISNILPHSVLQRSRMIEATLSWSHDFWVCSRCLHLAKRQDKRGGTQREGFL